MSVRNLFCRDDDYPELVYKFVSGSWQIIVYNNNNNNSSNNSNNDINK